MEMEKNMGVADRIVRPTIAAGIIAAYATNKIKGAVAITLLTLSAVFIATSAVGSCPVYKALNISTLED